MSLAAFSLFSLPIVQEYDVAAVPDWGDEPLLAVDVLDENANDYVPPPVDEWCECGKCHGWPCPEMNVCCKHHPIWNTKCKEDLDCITSCEYVHQLMLPAPLRMMYNSYCAYHKPVYEDAETLIVGERYSAQEIEKRKNDQKRLSAYRSLVFWAYPELRRGDRRPLPACTYLFVRAMFNSLDEDVWADYNHTVYAERVVGDNDI